MSTLTDLVKNSIANNNIAEMLELKEICDKLHRNDVVEGYAPEDMPSDALYEQLKTTLSQEQSHVANGLLKKQKKSDHVFGYHEKEQLSDMYMAKDAIRKKSTAELTDCVILCTPKYDGCSVCARFVWKDDTFVLDAAETRGDDIGYDDHKSTDMKAKLQILLDSDRCSWWPEKFNEMHKFANSVTIRGEVVLVDKSITSPPAPYVSGQIGLKYGTFDEKGVIGFKPFEITRVIDIKGKSRVPSQLESCKLFKHIDPKLDFKLLKLPNDVEKSTEAIYKLFNNWKETLESPIDGVVYCDETWSYPLYKEEAKGVKYGKYAMKPSDTMVSKLVRIEYNIAKDGKLTPIIYYKPIEYGGKKYEKAKSCISNLDEFIALKGLGIGSTIDVTFQKGIIPDVTDVVKDTADEKLTLPERCPICNEKINLKRNKSITTLTCTNQNCRGILIKKLNHFCTNLKIKGYGDKTLDKLLQTKTMSGVLESFGDIKKIILESNVSDFLIALDLFSKTNLKKNARAFEIKDHLVRDHSEYIRDVILLDIHTPIVDAVRSLLM